MKIAFFDIEPSDDKEKEDFFTTQLKHHTLSFSKKPLNLENLPEENDFEIISLRSKSNASKEVLERFPNLKFIAIRATGFNNVDLEYTFSKGIKISNVPSYGSHTVAEFAFGLILSLSRNIPQAYFRTKTDKELSYQGLRGLDLFGKTLGVIGTGKIGANVIEMAKAFGMKILAFDIFVNKELSQKYDFSYVMLDDLLEKSDIITLHCPSTPETHHLINMKNIEKIKKGAYLVNTARGDIVETQALLVALKSGILKAAALDVLEDENNITDEEKELMGLANTIITPHMAFYTKEAEISICQTSVDNINHFTDGLPQNLIN